MTEPKTLIDECRELLENYHSALAIVSNAATEFIRDPNLDIRGWPFKRIADHITNRYAEELASLVVIEPELERTGR